MEKENDRPGIILLTCSHCKGDAVIIQGETKMFYDVTCKTKGCAGHQKFAYRYPTIKEAVDAWNTRDGKLMVPECPDIKVGKE